jgi:hypothetical protein
MGVYAMRAPPFFLFELRPAADVSHRHDWTYFKVLVRTLVSRVTIRVLELKPCLC